MNDSQQYWTKKFSILNLHNKQIDAIEELYIEL